uniref:Uncharacterized protein n=1 Tax=Romanomermis culicivorax TaxID=13658 RepID=A0A915HFQ0_ROMCU
MFSWQTLYYLDADMLKGFLGGALAVPPLANVGEPNLHYMRRDFGNIGHDSCIVKEPGTKCGEIVIISKQRPLGLYNFLYFIENMFIFPVWVVDGGK